ncbi:EAL domain-containing protein [Undibacterium sp.]|uniref:bifunctional diguanylate cyclase/phosphodiesterase n=1 Tax=Undibacterium sp. TaxID=1914977 RepID=UPI0025DB72DB|nr:EAL domain-containing protein [Undibacterium sp.]
MRNTESSLYAREVWRAGLVFILVAIVFGIYVYVEKKIDHANELRHRSFLLADELRQSSDDLTGMARSYVITGERAYKDYYQKILSIRDGQLARPLGYENVYWDLVLAGQTPENGSGAAVALLDLMRELGLSEQETQLLANAKANSDSLALTELKAMRLIESGGAVSDAPHQEARAMLFDLEYIRAKAAIMQPINRFYTLMDQRTLAAVQTAEAFANAIRIIFCALAILFLLMLRRVGVALHATLGGSLDALHEHLKRLGHGDFSKPILLATGMEGSVLGLVATTQNELRKIEEESKQAKDFEHFRSRVLEVMSSSVALPEMLEAVVMGMQEFNPEMLCSILLLDKDGLHLGKGVAPSLPDFYNRALDGVAIGLAVGSCGTAAFTGERVVVEDIQNHPYWSDFKELAASAGLAACWSQPIRASQGQVLGTFAIYQRVAHSPSTRDIFLIEQAAHLVSIAIERSQAAENLRESEAHFRLLAEDASDVVWRQDINNLFTYISPADERMRGYHASEVVGHHFSEMLTDEGVAIVARKLKEKRSADQRDKPTASTTFEVQQRCKDGRLIWTEILTRPDRNAQGKLTGFHGITRDITERKSNEMNLRLSEQRFATAFTSAPMAASIASADEGRFIEVNANYERDFGWSSADLIGKTSVEVGLWASEAVRQPWIAGLDARGRLMNYETVWNCKNGEQRQVSISGEIMTLDGKRCILAFATDITERKKSEEKINELAFYDQLTGLPNRTLLNDRLKQALSSSSRSEQYGAILFIDLDNFKSLNDNMGHDIGDALLKQVAPRLTQCVREGDTVARLGGDEFVVVLANLNKNELEAIAGAEAVAEKIITTVGSSYTLGSVAHHSTASVGITLFKGNLSSTDNLLKQADMSMYRAKAAGRNTFRFFDPSMEASVKKRAELDADLRLAVQNQQFLLHYQAQIAEAGRITGAEVLLRWQHPDRGMISPAEFIPAAEETGLIIPIGLWVLESACRQLALWAKQPAMAHLSVAVNVSAHQFRKSDFVAQVLAVIRNSGANPERLKLELTESLLVENVGEVIEKMFALKSKGLCFSLDDFGTGYSSLAYLKRLPLDQLKIDQSFVRDVLIDPNDAAIARTIIALGQSLGLAVIAEGVETVEQRDFLSSHGCHAYQGFLFSRPVPLRDFERLV